jgi:hypothetical protein
MCPANTREPPRAHTPEKGDAPATGSVSVLRMCPSALTSTTSTVSLRGRFMRSRDQSRLRMRMRQGRRRYCGEPSWDYDRYGIAPFTDILTVNFLQVWKAVTRNAERFGKKATTLASTDSIRNGRKRPRQAISDDSGMAIDTKGHHLVDLKSEFVYGHAFGRFFRITSIAPSKSALLARRYDQRSFRTDLKSSSTCLIAGASSSTSLCAWPLTGTRSSPRS